MFKGGRAKRKMMKDGATKRTTMGVPEQHGCSWWREEETSKNRGGFSLYTSDTGTYGGKRPVSYKNSLRHLRVKLQLGTEIGQKPSEVFLARSNPEWGGRGVSQEGTLRDYDNQIGPHRESTVWRKEGTKLKDNRHPTKKA